MVSTRRITASTSDLHRTKHQVLAPRTMTPILVSEAPFLLLVFLFGMGALITDLLNRL